MRICSFLPAATEMVCALGLEDQLVGITHVCDFPPSVRQKPVVVRSTIDTRILSPAAIDWAVIEHLKRGKSLYQIDLDLLRELSPTLLLTQHLCEVCGPSKPEALQALKALPKSEVCYFSPHSLADIWDNLRELGAKTDRQMQAQDVIAHAQERLQRIHRAVRSSPAPRVFFMEWVDPVFNGGHWVPDLIEAAGGRDDLANRGRDSVRVAWDRVLKYQPEVIVISPCGFNAAVAAKQASSLRKNTGWDDLPAVRNRLVYAVDANAYFARPGPRVVEGVELLGHLFHTEKVPWRGDTNAFHRVDNVASDVVF